MPDRASKKGEYPHVWKVPSSVDRPADASRLRGMAGLVQQANRKSCHDNRAPTDKNS
jgi:hypothetical protein